LPVYHPFTSFTEAGVIAKRRQNIVTRQLTQATPMAGSTRRRIPPLTIQVRTFDGYLFLIKRQALDRYQRVADTPLRPLYRSGSLQVSDDNHSNTTTTQQQKFTGVAQRKRAVKHRRLP